MALPFIMSALYTMKNKRTILQVPDKTSEMPFHSIVEKNDYSGNLIKKENFEAPAGSVIEDCLFVKGRAFFGRDSKLSGVHAKKLIISERCQAESSLIAEDYLYVGECCSLLDSAECCGIMDIADGTSFFDLYSETIHFSGGSITPKDDCNDFMSLFSCEKPKITEKNIHIVEKEAVIEKNIMTRRRLDIGRDAVVKGFISSERKIRIGDSTMIGGDVISKNSLIAERDCLIVGDISAEKEIELKEKTVVLGNVISQKSIIIGTDCIIKGNVFAQNSVEINDNVTIGTDGQIKSVISGGTISILGNCTIYGRVRAVKGGKLTIEHII